MHRQPWKSYIKAPCVLQLGYTPTMSLGRAISAQQRPQCSSTWFINSLSSNRNKERPKRSFPLAIKPERKFTFFDPSRYICWTVSLQLTYFAEAEVEERLQMLLDKELVPVAVADGGSRILFPFTLSIKQCCQTHISFSVKHFISQQPVWSLKATVCSASVLQKAALLKWLQKRCHRDTVNCSFCVYLFLRSKIRRKQNLVELKELISACFISPFLHSSWQTLDFPLWYSQCKRIQYWIDLFDSFEPLPKDSKSIDSWGLAQFLQH